MKSVIALMVLGIWALGIGASASAQPQININVKTVLASTGSRFVDPGLSPAMIKELQSVFRYSSYRILAHNNMRLGIGDTGQAALPGSRMLRISPQQVVKDRAQLKLEIFRKRQQIFQTVIQLRNRGSIIVGGPKHKDGVLLFKISSSF